MHNPHVREMEIRCVCRKSCPASLKDKDTSQRHNNVTGMACCFYVIGLVVSCCGSGLNQ